MKIKHLIAAIIGFLLMIPQAHAEIDAAKAENFIKKTTQEGIVEIINAKASTAERDARFEKLFNSALDLNYIGKFVLGRNWKTASSEQRERFIDAYRKFNIKTW